MRKLIQAIKNETKYYDSIWQYIYLHDWFNPIYRLVNLPHKVYTWIEKFIYYGRIGANRCVDFDAMSMHVLIYAHIRRVRAFMSNPKNTHTVWTTKPNKGLFRRLKELEEYSRRFSEGEDQHYDNFSRILRDLEDKYGKLDMFNINYPDKKTKTEANIKIKRALQKDENVLKFHRNRYFELLKNYVPRFWD